MTRIAILLSGRGSNMEAIVRQTQAGILKDCCTVSVVLSNRPEAGGLEIARNLGIKTAVVESAGKKRREHEQEMIDLLRAFSPDYLVMAGFMRILSPLIIEHYRNRIINIHPADTRRFRGLGGYEWAFKQGLETTCITVHYVDEGVDTGPIIAQREVDLGGATSLEEIERRGLVAEHSFYSEVLRKIFKAGETTTTELFEQKREPHLS